MISLPGRIANRPGEADDPAAIMRPAVGIRLPSTPMMKPAATRVSAPGVKRSVGIPKAGIKNTALLGALRPKRPGLAFGGGSKRR